MALQKSQPTKFGVDAAYWTLAAVQDNYEAMTIDVAYAGYASKAAAESGSHAMALWNKTFPVSAMRLSSHDVETLVAADANWAGAKRIGDDVESAD